ncbi:alpha/beta fold hydrolase [Promineifilum sp.]|uniref:alpha/beta fold hydrolase n=1 Tax=Promineifilum sp. TaxID=2664178 RepID=UPI0035B3B1CF
MEKVTSPDGAPIAFHRRGSGPPLILVPGSGAANPVAWADVIPALAARFTVYAVDRRGRGESGDGPTYALQREAEDLAAVARAADEPANLLGHSFGALCALEAALLIPNLHRLILYEPTITLPGLSLYQEEAIARLQALLDAGDRESVLTVLYREIVMMPQGEFEQLQASPLWPARLAAAHTVVRESRTEEQYEFDAARFKNLRTPTLLLLGGDSAPLFKKVTKTIAAALTHSQIAVLPEQQHVAMYTAPDLFLREVLNFLAEPE